MGKKFLTFSYDDGVVQDRRLVEMMNEYGLKGTFNLNSGLFGESHHMSWDKYSVQHEKILPEEVFDLYKGHEVAGHTLTHPALSKIENDEVIRQVEEDRLVLSKLCGYNVRGFAYPGGPFYTDETIKLLKNHTGVEYARSTCYTFGLGLPEDWYQWQPSCFHCGNEKTELMKKLLESDSDEDMMLYVFGHAYELEAYDCWDEIEDFFKLASGRSDITYATNIEIKDYICGKNK